MTSRLMVPQHFRATPNPRPKPVIAPSQRRRFHPGSVHNLVFIGIGCAALLATVYILAKQGVSAPTENPATIRAALEKLRADTAAADTAWTAARKRFTADESEPTEADLRLLDTLVDSLASLESKSRVEKERHLTLQKLRDDYRGKILHRESLAVEKQAIGRENDNDNPGAEALYLKAAALERTVAEKFPSSASKSIPRIVMLESRAKVLRAKPLWEKSKADEATGDARRDAGDLPAAAAAYDRAWATHTLLDTEYRGITPADLGRTRALGRKRADAHAHALMSDALALASDAERNAAAGTFDDIPKRVADADATIALIVATYPESTYARPEWTAPLRRRLINAASAADCRHIDGELGELDAALRRGDFTGAVSRIDGLVTEITRVREKFRGGDRPSADTLARVRFLSDSRNEIPLIHKFVNPRLRTLKETPRLAVFETETPQGLYTQVTREDNPSAVRGDTRPVESLTRGEAAAFCQQLGWILGRPVRLPTEPEFRALAAPAAALPGAELAKVARSIDSGDGAVTPADLRPAGPAGLRDTLGNVAEWLAGDPARVAGGDAESTLAQLAAIPVREQPATRRSRFVGFRFVVDTGDAAPSAR